MLLMTVNVLKSSSECNDVSHLDEDRDQNQTKFRQYELASDRVKYGTRNARVSLRLMAISRAFYREQHGNFHRTCGDDSFLFLLTRHVEKQTVEFNTRVRARFCDQEHAKLGVWEAMELLNTLVDDSDPDTDLSQLDHLIQTAEAIRRDGKPDWMQVVGLIHDLGKLLFVFGSE